MIDIDKKHDRQLKSSKYEWQRLSIRYQVPQMLADYTYFIFRIIDYIRVQMSIDRLENPRNLAALTASYGI